MLRTLSFIVVMVLVAYLVYLLLEFVISHWIGPKICDFALDSASDYLIEHGRGFYEDKTKDAIYMEASVRTWLLLLLHVGLIVLTLCFVSGQWAFWIVPKWAIKIGVLLGIAGSGFCYVVISVVTFGSVGRLLSVDADGVCHFRGIWHDDFVFDASKYWERDDYPPTDKVYMLSNFIDYLVIAPIEYYN